jgi:methionyl-tRNA formyltransferase
MDATKAEKISKEEARIDWNSTSQKIFRNIKAFYPAPVAWTTFRNQVLRIEKAQISQISGLSPGQLRVVDRELHVGTCDGSLQIHEFVPSGKKSMDVKSWLNGARIEIDECFE